jgi:hypothetical protein
MPIATTPAAMGSSAGTPSRAPTTPTSAALAVSTSLRLSSAVAVTAGERVWSATRRQYR